MEHDGKRVCRLKGGNIRACMDNHLMALPQEELVCRSDRTMAVVQRGIIKELLPVRGTGEGSDLENQQNNRGGGVMLPGPPIGASVSRGGSIGEITGGNNQQGAR
jgi:hypothetical protein